MESEETVFGLRLLTVTQINEQVKYCLEDQFGLVAVTGEVADLACPRSGHVYFTLRDPGGQLKAVLWRGTARALSFSLEDGMEVILLGRLSLYTPRGSYQIIVSEVLPKGKGAIHRAFEQLKRKLAAEGLFREERKKPIPFLPSALVVITSPTGAAVQDIIRTALSRFPLLTVRIIPVRVQGREAPDEITAALEAANRPGVGDVILLGRGGGGVEDLWAFNDEKVVRAVAASRLPVISCVGHETDVTLSDLAADLRASTPTRAAEFAVPLLSEITERLEGARQRSGQAVRRHVERLGAELELVASRPAFREPDRALMDFGQYVDDLGARLDRALSQTVEGAYNRLRLTETRLAGLNPFSALRRGYAVVRFPSGRLVRTVKALRTGDRLELRLVDGACEVVVEKLREESLGGGSGQV